MRLHSTISRALCSFLGEKTGPGSRRKDGIGQIPCDHLQSLQFMFSDRVTAPAAQPSPGQGILQRPYKEIWGIQVPSGATSQAPEQDKGDTRPLQKSEGPSRCNRLQREQAHPGVHETAGMEVKFFTKPGLPGVSVLAQKTIIWGKQVTPTLQSHPGAGADWPPDTAGNRLKGPSTGQHLWENF